MNAYADVSDDSTKNALTPPIRKAKEKKTALNGRERITINKQLIGFPRGAYLHPETYNFSVKTVEEIESKIKKGYRIQRIEMHGYADGIKNNGVDNWSNIHDSSCKLEDSGKIDDIGLAYLRVCLPKEIIIRLLGYNVYTGKITISSHDEPDNGHIGNQYRKSVIKVVMNKHK